MKSLDTSIIKKKIKLENELRSIKMTERVIEKFMQGEQVVYCNACGTPNMYPVHIDLDRRYILYECDYCKKTWMESMDLKKGGK